MILGNTILLHTNKFQVLFYGMAPKTETFGFGLMDIGVGSFVFAAGLVSQEARKGSKGGRFVSFRFPHFAFKSCVTYVWKRAPKLQKK